MSKDEGIGAGSLLVAFLAGAVTGAAVALLYAPQTGREARELLSEKAREGRDKAAEAVRQGREMINQGREVLNRQRETIATAIERGREAYQQAREKEQV